MIARQLSIIGAFLFPGIAILAWALLLYAPELTRLEEEPAQLAKLLAAQEAGHIAAVKDTLSLVSLTRRLQDPDRAVCDAYLADVVASNSNIGNLTKLDPNGRVLCSAKPAPANISFGDHDFFREVQAAKSFIVTGFRIGQITHKPQIGASLPILDPKTGAMLYVVHSGLDLVNIGKSLAEAPLAEDESVTLIDRDGIVLASQRDATAMVGKPFPELTDLRQTASTRGILKGRKTHGQGRLMVGIAPLGDGAGYASVIVMRPAPMPLATVLKIAVGTILLGAALAGGMLFVMSRDLLWRMGSRRAYAAGLAGVVLIVAAGIGVALRLLSLEGDRIWWVEHTHEVIDTLAAATANVSLVTSSDQVSKARGTADDAITALLAAKDLKRQSNEIVDLVADNPAQLGRARQADALIGQLLDLMRRQVGTAEANPQTAPVETVSEIGRDLAVLLDSLKKDELSLLDSRKRSELAAERQAMVLSALIGALALVLLIGGARIVLTQARARVATEAALAERERQYRLLTENVRDVIVTIDLAGIRRYVSPACIGLYGYQPEELVGQRSVDLAHPDDAPRLAAMFAMMASGLEEGNLLVRAIRKDGTVRWVDLSLRLVRDAQTGAPQEIIGVMRDADDRVATEDLLRTREEQFRLIAENAGDLIVTSDLKGKRLYVSPSYKKILGYGPDELIGQKHATVIHPDDNERLRAAFEAVVAGKTVPPIIGRAIHKDGRLLWLESSLALIRDTHTGKPVHMVSVIRDITDKKAIEDDLAAANRKLTELTLTDALTGIANRRRFDLELAQEWQRAVRTKEPLSLLMIDIDRFKALNDRYGHQHGDECLQRVASALARQAGRVEDVVTRFGGEEFAIILPRTDIAAARLVAERMRAAVEALEMPHVGSELGVVTVSIGAAMLVPVRDTGGAGLIEAADKALYSAKRAGRNRVVAQGDRNLIRMVS